LQARSRSGKTVAGSAAFRNHLSYLPLSGSVLPQLADELEGDKKLIAVRFSETARRPRR
jgi:hypothetical protein